MSFGVLTCLAGYLIFHITKLSQMVNWNAPLQKARRAAETDILFSIFGARNEKI